MIIIPAVDIRNGCCVRLDQGRLENETIYSKDPLFIAKLWKAQGASRMHVVDLDGAFMGIIHNLAIIEKIVKEVGIPVQVGGGIRNMETIEDVFSKGVHKIVLGTAAVYDTELVKKAKKKFGSRIIISVDAVGDKVAIGGWKDVTSVAPGELGKKICGYGFKEIIFTDIKRDGMMGGPNLESIANFASKVKASIIIAGGITTLKDIKNIINLKIKNISGIIIGKAPYTESIKLADAIKLTVTN